MLPLPSAVLRFQVAGEVCVAGAWQGFSRTPRTPRSSPRSLTLRAGAEMPAEASSKVRCYTPMNQGIARAGRFAV